MEVQELLSRVWPESIPSSQYLTMLCILESLIKSHPETPTLVSPERHSMLSDFQLVKRGEAPAQPYEVNVVWKNAVALSDLPSESAITIAEAAEKFNVPRGRLVRAMRDGKIANAQRLPGVTSRPAWHALPSAYAKYLGKKVK